MHRERRIQYETIAQGQLSGLKVAAPSLQRLFIDSALALSDYRIQLDLVKDTTKKAIAVKGDTLEALFLNWLNAVADAFNQEQFLPYRIVFTVFDGNRIEATLTGEAYESHRHGYPRPVTRVPKETLTLSLSPDNQGQFQTSFYLATQ